MKKKKTPATNIAKELEHLAIPIDSVALDPKNAKRHGSSNVAVVMRSLERFGQRAPIIVQKEGMVVRAGNGRLMAARKLGWERIAALIVDEADVEATAYALVDNRSSELSDWNYSVLAEQMRDLSEVGVDVTSLGWSEIEMNTVLTSVFESPADEAVPEVTLKSRRLVQFSQGQFDRLVASYQEHCLEKEDIVSFVLRVVPAPSRRVASA